jgi:hypothetical protein
MTEVAFPVAYPLVVLNLSGPVLPIQGCALGGSVLQYQTARGYDSVVMIATTANSISSAFLDPFCFLLASNVTF